MKIFLLFVAGMFLCFSGYASDHIDGVPTIDEGQADLTDLYAFPTPGQSGNLSVILNMYAGVKRSGHFSKKVDYEVQVRSLEKNAAPAVPGFRVFESNAVKVYCKFTDPGHHSLIHGGAVDSGSVSCEVEADGQMVDTVEGKVGQTLQTKSVKLFTGPRTDAFFLSYDHFQDVIWRKGFSPSPEGSVDNLMHTVNVLSIAMEIDLTSYGLNPELVGVSGQSVVAKDGSYIDRVGRPEITNFSLHDFSKTNPIKRSYNQKPHFAVSSDLQDTFQARLIENITAYDFLDDTQDWNSEDLNRFTQVLVDDYLVVNMKGICQEGVNEFLEIEKALLMGSETNSCGGRFLEDDIMATLTGYYLKGFDADLGDYINGVVAPYQGNSSKSVKSDFPYLDKAGITTLKMSFLLGVSKKMQE